MWSWKNRESGASKILRRAVQESWIDSAESTISCKVILWPHRGNPALQKANFSSGPLHGGADALSGLDYWTGSFPGEPWVSQLPSPWLQDSHWQESVFPPSRTMSACPSVSAVRASSEHGSWLYGICGIRWPGFCTWERHFTCFLHLLLKAKSTLTSCPGFPPSDFMEHTAGVCQHGWILVDYTISFLSSISAPVFHTSLRKTKLFGC